MLLAENAQDGKLYSLKTAIDEFGMNPKKWPGMKCYCCEALLHGNDKPGALGIKSASKSLTAHKPKGKSARHGKRYAPGWSHPDPENIADPVLAQKIRDCDEFYKNKPGHQNSLFGRLTKNGVFHRLERKRNLEELNKPGVKDAIEILEHHFMKKLTGSPIISDTDRKALDDVTKRLIGIAGLADNMWALTAMKFLALGAKQGPFTLGMRQKPYTTQVRFEGTHKKQKLKFTFVDREIEKLTSAEKALTGKGSLEIPEKMFVGRAKPGGGVRAKRNERGYIDFIPLSREYMHNIVKQALMERRATALREEAERAAAAANALPAQARLDFSAPVIETPKLSEQDTFVLTAFAGKEPKDGHRGTARADQSPENKQHKKRLSRSKSAVNERIVRRTSNPLFDTPQEKQKKPVRTRTAIHKARNAAVALKNE